MYRNCLVDGIFRWSRRGRVDLILVDELGYVQMDRRGAELLFQVLTEREERSAIAIASNGPFSSWTKTFTDPRLCAAIVDRLTFAGQIIETGSTSYRLAHARTIKPPRKAPRPDCQTEPMNSVVP
jgi:DNA replication protein DnaC